MTSTRSYPRIGQGNPAISSLGAVGGPRGTAAGALRILVEFFTSYNPAGAKALEAELATLDKQEAAANTKVAQQTAYIDRMQVKSIKTRELIRTELDAKQRKAFRSYQTMLDTGTRVQRKAARDELQGQLLLAVQGGKITKQQAKDVLNLHALETRRTTEIGKRAKYEQTTLGLIKEQKEGIQDQVNAVKAVPGRLTGKLTALGIGALGGLVGGAVLGIGWQLADQAIQAVGEGIQDIIDPARHAREGAADLATAISKIGDAKNLEGLAAVQAYLESLGMGGKGLEGPLGMAYKGGLAQQALPNIEATLTQLAYPTAAWDEAVKKLTADLIKADKVQNKLVVDTKNLPTDLASNPWYLQSLAVKGVADESYYTAQAIAQLNDIIWASEAASRRDAEAKAAEAQALAWAALKAQLFAEAIQAAAANQITSIQSQYENAPSGPSARTQALQAQIEALQNAGGGGSSQSKELNDQRALLLLRQKLYDLTSAQINLEQYSGKFLLAAIDAKIAALEKEGQAQDRLNQLQDLQYKESQTLQRNEGESIRDFLERRAQQNREFLKERADMARQDQIDALSKERDKVEFEVELAENAEAQKTAAATAGTNARLKQLQKELEASQKADAAAAKAKQDQMNKEIQAARDAANKAIQITSQQGKEELRLMMAAAEQYGELLPLKARITALKTAKETIRALVASFGLSPTYANQLLNQIDQMLASAAASMARASNTGGSSLTGRSIAVQHGGVFSLNNGANPFGQNVRVGEGGTELGVVLSNRVYKALKESQGQVSFGDINIQTSEDPRRTEYRLKRTMKEALSEALR